jgi:hypothetical protein
MSFYKMERGWMESGFFGEAPYSDREAWCWMIEEAAYEPTVVPVNGEPVTLQRGQFSASIRFMAEKFQWSKDRVTRFMNRLTKWEMVSTDTSTGQNLVTICNYSKYQDTKDSTKDRVKDRPKDDPKDAPKDKQEELKEIKKDIGDFPEETWNDFLAMRKKIGKAATDKAQKLLLGDLKKLKAEGHDINRVLEKSIINSWQGVFPLKPETSSGVSAREQARRQTPC